MAEEQLPTVEAETVEAVANNFEAQRVSRSHEFHKARLFHGTTHEFKPGDIIDSQSSMSPWAYSTPDQDTATSYASLRNNQDGGSKSPRVYEVEAQKRDRWHGTHGPDGPVKEVRSKKGLKVLREITPQESN
jgi:hypothetical protein